MSPSAPPHLRGRAWFACALVVLAGCRTAPPAAPRADATFLQGQAVWRPDAGAPELAGELVLVTDAAGATLVEFAKPPVVIARARLDSRGWELDRVGRRSRRGNAPPPSRPVWLHLAAFVRDGIVPPGWIAGRDAAADTWWLEHPASGERLAGFLQP